MPDINDLHQERMKLINDMRAVNDAAIAAGTDIESDELTKYNTMEARLKTVTNSIKRETELAEAHREAATISMALPSDKPPAKEMAEWEPEDDNAISNSISADYKMVEKYGLQGAKKPMLEMALKRATNGYQSAFWAMQRIGKNRAVPEIHNALETGTATEGGYLVPTEFETTLVMKKKLYNEIRSVATTMTTSADLNIPVETDEGTATWTAEEAAYTESDTVFGQVILSAHKLGRIIKISEELLQDAFFDMSTYIGDAYGRSFGLAEEAAYVAGTGTTQPTGIIPSADAGVTAAGATAITADEVIDLYHSLNRPYRAQSRWLTSDAVIAIIRKLKDANGQYIWQPGLQADEPDRILSRPVIVSDYVPAPTTGLRSLAIGDLSYYRIVDRIGTVMQRLDELYAANGQVGFRMRSRTDGKLTLSEAVKVLTQA